MQLLEGSELGGERVSEGGGERRENIRNTNGGEEKERIYGLFESKERITAIR